MDLAVGSEVAGLCKFLTAHSAFKRLFASVSSHMNFQSARSHETLFAGVAFERPFTRMPPKVVTQVAMRGKRPVAIGECAPERLLAIMDPLVSF